MNLFDLCVYKNLNKESGGDVDVSSLVATENKTYNAGEGKAYNPVVVNVPTPSPSLQSLTASHNGYFVPSSGYDGFSEVTVDVATPLETLSATENGTYTPSSGYEGFSEVTVNVPLPNNAYLLESQKNDVVTIQNGAEFDLPKLIASIEPQQDLHGYDAPWVAGGGKNKLPLTIDAIKSLNTGGTWNNNAYSINGGTLTLMTDNSGNVIGININGTFNDSITFHLINSNSVVFPNNQYILNGISGGSASTYRYLYLSPSSGYLYSDGGDTLLNIDEGVSKIRLLINSGYNAQNVKVYPMVRLASVSDATFAPYSNICPISGWDECKVTVADDLENPTVSNVYTIDLDGTRYGGKLDVVSGVLTLTDGFISSYNGDTLPSTWISDRDVYAEGTTPTIGAEVVYELATPQTYQLTPTQVKSLLGVNNIFADTGKVDVQIWTKEVTS